MNFIMVGKINLGFNIYRSLEQLTPWRKKCTMMVKTRRHNGKESEEGSEESGEKSSEEKSSTEEKERLLL